MTKKRRKYAFFFILGLIIVLVTTFILKTFETNIVFFRAPSYLVKNKDTLNDRIRLGGLVQEGTIRLFKDGLVIFSITDTAHSFPVQFKGILPDLFRENQGVIVEGRVTGDIFLADKVYAKHDENYMPPEVAKSIKELGTWENMSIDNELIP